MKNSSPTPITTIEKYLIDIFTGSSPGLLEINHTGTYGYYNLFRVIYADLCQLWEFEVFQHTGVLSEFKFKPFYDENSDEVVGVVQVFPAEITLNSSYEIKRRELIK